MMSGMLKTFLLGVLAATIGLFAADEKVERGRYLSEEVGKCQDCHTARDAKGEFDRTKWLKGTVLDFSPLNPVPGWRKAAPDITGAGWLFEQWKDEGLIRFLTTGLNPRGAKAGPPMPAYTLKREDAEAIVVYLKSLK
jgi:mono/diheme cytochrome c family protein